MTAPTVRRPLVLVAVLAAMFMVAIEATIVSTAMPQIAASLGDLHLYSWVFAAFLLAQTATTIVFGKLSDLYGRRPIMLIGIALFLVGSLLCGFATSMPVLIGFRLLQGLGAGSILPMLLTIVGDLYPGNERGRIQGWLSSVWGISSVLGPLAGGLIVQRFHWAWVFWINLPIGLVAAALFAVFLRERVAAVERRVDTLGAGLFAVGCTALLVALTEVGQANGAALAAAALAAVCGVLFVWQERRAPDPMIAIELWSRRSIAMANVATLFFGMALIGLSAFLPMYVQGVMGRSALVAGFTLTAVTFGWPIGAMISARYLFPRYGLRATLLLGGMLLPVGAAVMLLLGPGSNPALAGAGSLVMGFAMGFGNTAALILIQSSVPWEERGAATSANVFARNLGSTLGATVLGGVLNVSLAAGGTGVGYDDIRQLLDHAGGRLADLQTQLALGDALHWTFWAMFAVTVGGLVGAALVPRQAVPWPGGQPAE